MSDNSKEFEQVETWNQFVSYHVPIGLRGVVSNDAAILWGYLQRVRGNPKDQRGRPRKRWCHPGYAAIAQDFKVSEKTVARWIAELVRERLIRVCQRGHGKTPELVFLDHSALRKYPLKRSTTEEDCGVQDASSAKTDLSGLEDSAWTEMSGLEEFREDRNGAQPGQICPLARTDLSGEYKEVGSSKQGLLNGVREAHVFGSSSSSSSVVGEHDDEDDDGGCVSPFGGKPTPPSAAEIAALSDFLHRSLAACTNGAPTAPAPHVVKACFGSAPGWSAAEICTAISLNFDESPGRPKSYGWYRVTIANIYEKRDGVAPELAGVEKRIVRNDVNRMSAEQIGRTYQDRWWANIYDEQSPEVRRLMDNLPFAAMGTPERANLLTKLQRNPYDVFNRSAGQGAA